MTQGDSDLLARLDERMKGIADDIAEMRKDFVTKAEFGPVRSLVFGAVALILIAFMGALLYLTGLQR